VAHTPAAVGVLASPLVIPQGADFAVAWQFAEGTPLAEPAGWPTQWLARMEVRAARGGQLLARFHSVDVTTDGELQTTAVDVGSPSAVPGVPDGTSVAQILLVTSSITSTWTWADASRSYPFDLELEHIPTGRVVRLLEGTVRLSREVTTGV
jgi:hypothetical protein